MLATGIGYLGQAALRREQCDVHAVGLRSRRYLVMARQATMGTVVFSAVRSQAILAFSSEEGVVKYERLKLGGGQAYDRSND
jgi:hypothetical protein